MATRIGYFKDKITKKLGENIDEWFLDMDTRQQRMVRSNRQETKRALPALPQLPGWKADQDEARGRQPGGAGSLSEVTWT